MEKEKFNIYCNNIELGLSRYDLVLRIGSATNDKVEELGQIILSPVHAKVLTNLLAENIRVYEQLFGEINIKEPSQEDLQKGGITIEPFKK